MGIYNILKIILNYNNIDKIDKEDYESYNRHEPDYSDEAIINYETVKGLNDIMNWINNFSILSDDSDYHIIWFTNNNTFYGKIFSK